MSYLEQAGSYLADVTEIAVTTTKAGFPQAVIRVNIVKRYVETPQELQHYGITEAAYMDFPESEFTGYLVLFNSAEEFIAEGPNKNSIFHYQNLKDALGWEGVDFDELQSAKYVGTRILVKAKEESYNGKTTLKMSVDNQAAPPTRELKKLDASAIKNLNAKLRASKIKTNTTVAAVAVTNTLKSQSTKIPPPKIVAPAPKPSTAKPADLPSECYKEEAWNYAAHVAETFKVNELALQQAWTNAMAEVAPDLGDDDLTTLMWAEVRDSAVKAIQ